jgi:branched-chain amino acid transport system ATP-binding protein
MLVLSEVHTYYGESHVLDGVSLSVEDGSVVALLGRNGMGKTTTIRSIIGFTPARRGIIRFKGEEITQLRPYQIAKMGIGLIPQGRAIFPSLSVSENLTVGANRKRRESEWSLEKVYSLFPVLQARSKIKGNLLSGGEQQMLAICRGLMTNPDLLLMDEPSEGLAPNIVREIGSIIGQLKDEQLSILLVEQNVAMALRASDYAYIISKGKIAYESSPGKLEKSEEIMVKYLCATK